MNRGAHDEDTGRTLRLLELLDHNGTLTQRELSRKMGIALGLVNLSIKRLIAQEMLKVKRMSARRFCYLITPLGMAEKGHLSARLFADSFAMYRGARRVLLTRLRAMKSSGHSRVVLYGNGELAEITFITIREVGLALVAVAGQDGMFLGEPVKRLATLDPDTVDRVLFVGDGRTERATCLAEMALLGLPPDRMDDLSGLPMSGEPELEHGP